MSAWVILAAVPPALFNVAAIADELKAPPPPLPPRAGGREIRDRVWPLHLRRHTELLCGPHDLMGQLDTSAVAGYRPPLWARIVDGMPLAVFGLLLSVLAIWGRADAAIWGPALAFGYLEMGGLFLLMGSHMRGIIREAESVWAVPKVPLDTAVEDLIEAWGPPDERGPHDELKDAEQLLFKMEMPHEVVIVARDGRVREVTVWSPGTQANQDLACMFHRYGEGHEWITLNEGYMYRRSCGKVQLWCSAVPAIGVGYVRTKDEVEA